MLAPLYPPASGPAAAAAMRARGMAVGLRDRGHAVTVVCGMPRGTEPDLSGGVEVIPAPWLDLEGIARAAGLKSGTLVKPRFRDGPPRHTLLRSTVSKFLPDRYGTWIPGAVRAARRAAGERSLIFSTGPVSSHMVARLMRGERTWVADLNDLWAYNPRLRRSFLRARIEQLLEHSTIGTATALTTVNEPMREELERRYGELVTTIFSGFNPAEYEHERHRDAGGPVELLFAGTVYPNLDLVPLYEAVRDGKNEGWLRPEALRISVVGRLTERVAIESAAFGVTDIIRTNDLIPRPELLEALVQADALILPLYETDPYALPMRFFEYVGSGRPMIGYGPPERIGAQLIRQYKLGTVVTDRREVRQLLRQLVEDRSSLKPPESEDRETFTWDRSISRLDQLMVELADSAREGEPSGSLTTVSPRQADEVQPRRVS